MTRSVGTAIALLIMGSLFFVYSNCGLTQNQSDDDARTMACEDATPQSSRVQTYGSFDPVTMDQCHAYTGSVSRWTGMPTQVAHIALASSMFGGGTACGSCFKISGPRGAITGRVAFECATCAADQMQLDVNTFNQITGGNGTGQFNVEIQPIACPITQGFRVVMNAGTNAYFLNLSPANFRHPVDTVQVNYGQGFTAMARGLNSNDFTLTVGSPLNTTVQIKAVDIYGQTLQSSFDPTAGAATLTNQQFADCL